VGFCACYYRTYHLKERKKKKPQAVRYVGLTTWKKDEK